MRLSELLEIPRIVIQCHDAPDADTVASGFAIYDYLKQHGIEVRLIYSGEYPISKPNMKWMIEHLQIPLEYVNQQPECDLLLTVDCQYGSGNVKKWDIPDVAVIDHHHRLHPMAPDRCEIRSQYGSCSTVVWAMLQAENWNVNENSAVSTALYYGLYMDTAQFQEIRHPMDKDMRDSLKFQEMDFFNLINTNMTTEELDLFADAIEQYQYDETYQLALVPVQECDPNLLGMISDFMIQVDQIQLCIAYTFGEQGCKLSVRSCTTDSRANDVAEYLCRDVGSGGGQKTKAGGFISRYLLDLPLEAEAYTTYIKDKLEEYFSSFQIIHAKDYEVDLSVMKRYIKKKSLLGVAHIADFLPTGTPLLVRTLEGDLECVCTNDLYVMVGIDGEVYPIREKKFFNTYSFCEGKPEYHSEYEPTVHNTLTGESYWLRDHLKTCCSKGTSFIYAKEVDHNIKVFTQWDEYKYLTGVKGDYLAARLDDLHDVYMIQRDIFLQCYELA